MLFLPHPGNLMTTLNFQQGLYKLITLFFNDSNDILPLVNGEREATQFLK